ncbi:type II toxin-antitoxin system HipA family toxinoxin YjjJ [Dyella tabacisoli]|uniref:Type II toxin-antitoxin system HipA family toxinoxin YjjJ n=1 Tax=Dyella tabacisoli TaxID=2282381 RepID=A0A369UKH4_9GAMM|nr:type II toxin-antitoxin system HipA family toxinoxin YjjJ [Dyella tabacisoli]
MRIRRVATAGELGEVLGSSQPTVSRLLAGAGDQIVKIGRARRTRYAAVRDVRGLGHRWPLYRIDSSGRPQSFGHLVALHGDGCWLDIEQPADWLRGEFSDGLFPGLPWFLDDMRPQGFLGRMFAQHYARELGLGDDILRWDGNAVLAALLLRGEDAPGNFVLGEPSLDRALRAEAVPIPSMARALRYAALADATLAGDQIGSSAAGEQPKFTACVEAADGSLRHVIVKFSERVDANPVGRRWADLLIGEHLAGQLLAEHGQPSATSELVWSDGRLCLESTRFDRIGAHGRRGVVSLAAWSDAHDGVRDNWPAATGRMQRDGWLTVDAVMQIQRLWWFGQMIGNTDMHFGNFAFFLDDALPLTPCPSYDMLPMLYRPASNGSLPPRNYQPPPPLPAALSHWQQAATWAAMFWQRVIGHPDVSEDFRRIAGDNHTQLIHLRQRFT